MGNFFGRLKKGAVRLKEIVKEQKQKAEQRQFRRDLAKEESMRKLEAKANRQIAFANLQARRLRAKASVYEAAKRVKKSQSGMGVNPIVDFGGFFKENVQPTQPQQSVKKKKTQPQPSFDDQITAFMRR